MTAWDPPRESWRPLLQLATAAAFCWALLLLPRAAHAHSSSLFADPNAPRDHSEANRDVLIFGGNGFIGSHLVERLVARGYRVSTLHRNNTYWGWASGPTTRVIRCDRNYDLTECDGLAQLEARPFLAVVDLSGYIDIAVMQGLQLLAHRFQYYLYLSTDSVYDVSDKRHPGPSLESDGAHPADPAVRARLRAGRAYAERKLTSEFVVDLLAQDYNVGYDYTVVRIPDTFGPRDTSYRFWFYMRALESPGPLRLPRGARDTRMSLAYVGDVAEFLAGLVDRYRREAPARPVKEVFNFAYERTWTPPEFLGALAEAMGLPGAPRIEFADGGSQLYPTVTSGPISVEKAVATFRDWLPSTPLQEALRKSVMFYRDVESRPADFPKESARFQELLAEWGGIGGGN